MLRISADLALRTIESSLRSIQREPDQKISLPLDVRGKSLGGEAALVQLLITWAQVARHPTIHLPVQHLSGVQIDDFVRNLHGLAVSLLCDSALDLQESEYFDPLQANGLLKLAQLDGREPLSALHRLHDFALLCADHLGRGQPRFLYFKDPATNTAVRNESDFRRLSNWIVRSITPEDYQSKTTEAFSNAVGSMIHEIFENTDEHATTDLHGHALSKSLRGLFAKHHLLTDRQIEELTIDNPALRRFCLEIPKSGNTRRLLEVSIFDSGPGLAQRVSNRSLSDLTTPEEFAAVQGCFRKGVSTKPRAGHGIGLHYVLGLLKERRGFLRVRTGRLSLYGDLSSYDTSSGDLNLALKDASDSEPRRLGRVCGTLITIMAPLMRS